MNLALKRASAGFAGALLLAAVAGAASAHVGMVGGGGMHMGGGMHTGMGSFAHAGMAHPGPVHMGMGNPGHMHMAHDHMHVAHDHDHDHHHHNHFFVGFAGYPYYDDYGYDYGGGCGYYRVKARETGSPYWWHRYRDCLYG